MNSPDNPSPPTIQQQSLEPGSGGPDPRFRLYWWSGLLLILVFLIVVGVKILELPQTGAETAVGELAGSLFAFLLICVLPGWLLFKISRSRRAGNITVALISGLVLAGVVGGVLQQSQNEQALQRFEQSVASKLEVQRDRLAQGTLDPAGNLAMAREFGASVDTLAEQVTGPERAYAMALAAVMRQVQPKAEAYHLASQALEETGWIDFSRLGSREDIAAALDALSDFERANDDFDQTMSRYGDLVRAALNGHNVPRDQIDDVVAEAVHHASLDIVSQIRQTDREIIAASRSILNRLDLSWGGWATDPNDGSLLVEGDEDFQFVQVQLDRRNSAAYRQGLLQQQMAERGSRYYEQKGPPSPR